MRHPPVLLGLCPLTLDDFCFDLLPIRALQNQIVSVNGCLHGIANYQAVSGIAGMLMQSFTSAKVHYIADLHLINGVFNGSSFEEAFVRTHIQQLARLKLSMRTCAQTDRA